MLTTHQPIVCAEETILVQRTGAPWNNASETIGVVESRLVISIVVAVVVIYIVVFVAAAVVVVVVVFFVIVNVIVVVVVVVAVVLVVLSVDIVVVVVVVVVGIICDGKCVTSALLFTFTTHHLFLT